jgi:hypothetical protein
VHDLNQAAAHDTTNRGDIDEGQQGDRQDHEARLKIVPATGGQPFQDNRKYDDQYRPHDKAGHGTANVAHQHDQMVRQTVLAQRGDGTHGHANENRQQHGGPADGQRYRQSLANQLVDRPVTVAERRPQVALQQALEVQQILVPQGQVQVVFGLQIGQHRGRDFAVAVKRAARCQVQQEITHGNDHQHGGDCRQNTSQGVRPHRLSPSVFDDVEVFAAVMILRVQFGIPTHVGLFETG